MYKNLVRDDKFVIDTLLAFVPVIVSNGQIFVDSYFKKIIEKIRIVSTLFFGFKLRNIAAFGGDHCTVISSNSVCKVLTRMGDDDIL